MRRYCFSSYVVPFVLFFFFFQAEDGIRDDLVTGVQTCALPILFTAAAGAWGPPLFMVCLIGGGLWLVTRDMRAHGSRLRGGVFAAMLGESIALALIFGFVVGSVTSGVLGDRKSTRLNSSHQIIS